MPTCWADMAYFWVLVQTRIRAPACCAAPRATHRHGDGGRARTNGRGVPAGAVARGVQTFQTGGGGTFGINNMALGDGGAASCRTGRQAVEHLSLYLHRL